MLKMNNVKLKLTTKIILSMMANNLSRKYKFKLNYLKCIHTFQKKAGKRETKDREGTNRKQLQKHRPKPHNDLKFKWSEYSRRYYIKR
jgi:hypothetical protein